jgi:hypothetical protein
MPSSTLLGFIPSSFCFFDLSIRPISSISFLTIIIRPGAARILKNPPPSAECSKMLRDRESQCQQQITCQAFGSYLAATI